MQMTFENENELMVYALARILCDTKKNHFQFVVQCLWWLAPNIGLEHNLIIDLKNHHSRIEGFFEHDVKSFIISNLHAG
jgi:hypothetical protein